MKKTVSFICVLLLMLSFSLPVSAVDQPDEPNEDAALIEEAEYVSDLDPYSFDSYTDMAEHFSAWIPVDGLESVQQKETISLWHAEEREVIRSDETYSVPEDAKEMLLQCTWTRMGCHVYIGLEEVKTKDVYFLGSVGGSVMGTLDLSSLPDGEYNVIMFGSNNPEIAAILAYEVR